MAQGVGQPVKITLYATYGGFVGSYEIPPYNGYPDAVFVGERIYVRQRGVDTNHYREGHFIHLREEDRRESSH